MKFVNFFAPENHYFCVAVSKQLPYTVSKADIKYANVDMIPYIGVDSWQFHESHSIGFGGASCKGSNYTRHGTYNNALMCLNNLSKKRYTSLAQHFADMYL